MSDLITGLLTALGSGVSAALATYAMNSNKEHVSCFDKRPKIYISAFKDIQIPYQLLP